jgi:glutathione S-transferase
MMQLLINSEETAAYLAKKFGVPDTLIRDPQEREQIVAMMQQMQQTQGQAPQPLE